MHWQPLLIWQLKLNATTMNKTKEKLLTLRLCRRLLLQDGVTEWPQTWEFRLEMKKIQRTFVNENYNLTFFCFFKNISCSLSSHPTRGQNNML